jgi:hypothetical protein
MRAPRLGSIAAVLAAVVVIALPASASAGQPLVSLKVAKHKDGPYKAFQVSNIALNETKQFYWKAKNVADGKLPDVRLTDSFALYPPGWIVRWFRGDDNITAGVHNPAGYQFGIKAGGSKLFRLKLKPTKTAGPVCAEASAGPPKTSPDSAVIAVNDALCSL